MLVNKRKEVLRLYREIIRTSRPFQWENENGEKWSKVLQQSARSEIESNRNETDSETIAKRLILGWDAVNQVHEQMAEKQKQFQDQQEPSKKN